jgi:hypothetical protein
MGELRGKRTLRRDIWRMADGSWGAEVERNGVGVGIRYVSLPRAIWHVLTVRRPDDYATLHVGPYNDERRPTAARAGEDGAHGRKVEGSAP